MIRLNAEQASLPGLEAAPPAVPQAPTHGRRFVSRAVDLRKPGVPDYVLGASTPERRRLLMQCELLKPDARWMLDRDDSPWYPSVTGYRQRSHGNWADVIRRVAHDLSGGRFARAA